MIVLVKKINFNIYPLLNKHYTTIKPAAQEIYFKASVVRDFNRLAALYKQPLHNAVKKLYNSHKYVNAFIPVYRRCGFLKY